MLIGRIYRSDDASIIIGHLPLGMTGQADLEDLLDSFANAELEGVIHILIS